VRVATLPGVDFDAVTLIIQDAAAQAITPRFRALEEADVRAKGADDVVTVADLESEALITSALAAMTPTIPVVGEGATAHHPDLPASLGDHATYWLLDPLDGTSNFVAGDPDIGVMLALVHAGDVVASWIWQPIREVLLVAERGAGAYRNGQRISPSNRPTARPASELVGWVWTRFLPADILATVETSTSRFAGLNPGPTAAAVAYERLLLGESDFSMYWRTEPWDHAPGALLIQEAGGAAPRLDGSRYRPREQADGLLLTRSASEWTSVRGALLGSHGQSPPRAYVPF
jgi:fructose-1,6-bisphosphatase/inositol monophosphatase family enzyme